MKKIILIFLISIVFLPINTNQIYAQKDQDAGDIARALEYRLRNALDFGCWSEKYKITNHQIVYFDIDKKSKEAILYFRFHPIHKLEINIIDFESDKISISERYIEIIGDDENNILIEPSSNKMFFKSYNSIKEIDISIVDTPNEKQRIVIDNIEPFILLLNNCNENEDKIADFYIFNTKIMSLELSRYLNSKVVWEMKVT